MTDPQLILVYGGWVGETYSSKYYVAIQHIMSITEREERGGYYSIRTENDGYVVAKDSPSGKFLAKLIQSAIG